MLRIFLFGLLLSVSSLAKTFTWATDSDPITMDPYSIYEINTTSFLGNLYEGLTTMNEKGEVVPSLATSWKKTSPTSMTFNLRKGVTFQDGTPFTADDVVFSLARVRSISGAGISSMLGSIKDIKKVDDHTVSIETERPNPLLLSELTLFYIMSKSWCEKNNATKNICSDAIRKCPMAINMPPK